MFGDTGAHWGLEGQRAQGEAAAAVWDVVATTASLDC
jgi:hypothetical protein